MITQKNRIAYYGEENKFPRCTLARSEYCNQYRGTDFRHVFLCEILPYESYISMIQILKQF